MSIFSDMNPSVRDIFDAILFHVSKFGPVDAKPQEEVIKLVAREPFAAIHPMMSALRVALYSDSSIKSERITRVRHLHGTVHNELVLTKPAEVDDEFIGWLRRSYDVIGRRVGQAR